MHLSNNRSAPSLSLLLAVVLTAQERVRAVTPCPLCFERQPLSLARRGYRRLSLHFGPRTTPR